VLISNLLKIVDTTIDKKITLVKLMGQLIFKPGSGDNGDKGSGNITPEDMALLRNIFNNVQICHSESCSNIISGIYNLIVKH